MSDYRIDFESTSDFQDANRLVNLLSVISEEDELEITMDNNLKIMNSVIDTLKNNDFSIISKNEEEGNKLDIIAYKMHSNKIG